MGKERRTMDLLSSERTKKFQGDLELAPLMKQKTVTTDVFIISSMFPVNLVKNRPQKVLVFDLKLIISKFQGLMVHTDQTTHLTLMNLKNIAQMLRKLSQELTLLL